LVLHSSPPAECPDCRQKDLEQLVSLCAVSSETTRQANLSAAHQKPAGVRKEKLRQDHTYLTGPLYGGLSLHEHFEDRPNAGHIEKAGHS